jgi:hypothetical protein
VPRYRIVNNVGTITKAETAFATTRTETFVTVTLPDNNVMAVYKDMADGNKGKAVVYNEAGDIVVNPVTFSENSISNVDAKLETNGFVVIIFTDESDSNKAKFVVINSFGIITTPPTTIASGIAYTRKLTCFPDQELSVVVCSDTNSNVMWLDIFRAFEGA